METNYSSEKRLNVQLQVIEFAVNHCIMITKKKQEEIKKIKKNKMKKKIIVTKILYIEIVQCVEVKRNLLKKNLVQKNL